MFALITQILFSEAGKYSTCTNHAAISAGMQMQEETKREIHIIKHTPKSFCDTRVPADRQTASCILKGASTWQVTAPNKAGVAEMSNVPTSPERQAITSRTCKHIYAPRTLINMADSQKPKCRMSIIKTS